MLVVIDDEVQVTLAKPRPLTVAADEPPFAAGTDPTEHRAPAGPDAGTRVSSPAPVEAPAPTDERDVDLDDVSELDTPWIVLVWNDPINLMEYVTFVFQKVFGYSVEKATSLMLDVHQKGKAVVSNGTREKAELDVFRLHEHGLWATMQQDD